MSEDGGGAYPRFTVITVCMNSSATIAETLDSVAGQNSIDVQHVVIDGGSVDGTIEIVKRHAAQNGTLWLSEPDRGIYDAMNKGLRLAAGDVIGFLNADDTFATPQSLLQVARVFARSPELAVVYGDVEFVRRPGGPGFRRYDSSQFRPDRLRYGWMPAHPALFVRAGLYTSLNGYRDDYKISGDFEFVVRLFQSDPAYQYLPSVIVKMLPGGMSNSTLRNRYVLNAEVVRACRENGVKTGWPTILSKYPRKLLEYFRRSNLSSDIVD